MPLPGYVDVRCEGIIAHGPKKDERCGRFLVSVQVERGAAVVRKKCERCKSLTRRRIEAA